MGKDTLKVDAPHGHQCTRQSFQTDIDDFKYAVPFLVTACYLPDSQHLHVDMLVYTTYLIF